MAGDSSSMIDLRPVHEMGARCASCRIELLGEAYQSAAFEKPVCKVCYTKYKERAKAAASPETSTSRKSVALPQLKEQARMEWLRPAIIAVTVLAAAIAAYFLTSN